MEGWQEVREFLALPIRELSGPVKLAELILWFDLAGGRVCDLVVSHAEWAAKAGRHRGRVKDWLRPLATWTLIDVIGRTPGKVRLHVYLPRPVFRELPAEQEQLLLDFDGDAEMCENARLPMVPMKKGISKLPTSQRTTRSKDTRDTNGTIEANPVPIGVVTAELWHKTAAAVAEYDALSTGVEQHRRRVEWLQAYFHLDAWFANYVASQVEAERIHHKHIKDIIRDTRLMKRVNNPGGFLRSKLRELPGWVEPRRRLAQ